MANTQPTFLRRFEVFARICTGTSAVILEPVQITLGFNGPVDRDSGMITNLSDVDAWIRSFKLFTDKKTYISRWAMCRLVVAKFKSLIDRKEFTEIHFKFQHLEVIYQTDDVFLKWHQHSVVSTDKLKWLSQVTLQLKSITKKWPPVTPEMEAKIIKGLKAVRLDKTKWNVPGMTFCSFEYVDPKLGSAVRI
jgi:hypothetical protein